MDDLTVFGQKCVDGSVKIYRLEGRYLRYKCTFPAGGWTPNYRNRDVVINCARWPLVWLPAEEKRKVKIEVLGGVAECTDCPPDVIVEIIDHDNDNESAG